jgi:hypothetical protein
MVGEKLGWRLFSAFAVVLVMAFSMMATSVDAHQLHVSQNDLTDIHDGADSGVPIGNDLTTGCHDVGSSCHPYPLTVAGGSTSPGLQQISGDRSNLVAANGETTGPPTGPPRIRLTVSA